MGVPGTDRRLGSEFGRLWTAATVSALGDGLTQIAGPLLAVSITRSPVLIAGLTVSQQLPWLLFALPGGAMVDRVDRRLAMTSASVARAAALGALACLVLIGRTDMPLLYLAFFAVGCAGLAFENASASILPALVGRAGLQRANGRLQSASVLTRSLAAPPSGAWLFALAAPLPFLLDAGGVALVAALAATLPARVSAGAAEERRATLRAAMLAGVRWLLGNRLLRTLALTTGISNIGLGAVFSVFVLAARTRYGTGPSGYGVLLAASAAGGLAGGLLAGRTVGSIGPGWVLRAELAVETLTYLGLALTRSAIAAGALLALLGMHLVMFSTVSASLRQSLVPAGMLGRVHGAYRLVSNGGMLAGAALGGLAGTYLGLTAPFWIGFIAMSGVSALVWGVLSNREIRAALKPGPRSTGSPG